MMPPEFAKYVAATIPTIVIPVMVRWMHIPDDICMELIGLWILALGGHIGHDWIKAHHEGKAKKNASEKSK